MSQMTSGLLAVPGASLYYERRGEGPALLLIHGGGMDAGPMERFADVLAAHRTVISYDRRGYGRSPMTDPPGRADRVQVDADDAASLIEQLTDGAADVFGSSSGAIATLDLLIRHPDRAGTVVPHEPPIVSLLPDATDRLAFFHEVYDTYRREGVEPAMRMHLAAIGDMGEPPPAPDADLPPHFRQMLARMPVNQEFWLENEIRQVPDYHMDFDLLSNRPGLPSRLILAGGQDSHEQYPSWPNRIIGERLGLPVVDFPGDHIGYVMHPVEFAARLLQVLDAVH
jgi:pimeloyl-ACP methyl ester carboxylesterase